MNWIYSHSNDDSARFILGEYDKYSDKTLICFGINPSTATPKNLDSTLIKIRLIASHNKYVNWITLNIYPQRATNPDNLHKVIDSQFHSKNLQEIKRILTTFNNADILWAYGNLITKRSYLKNCLNDILNLILTVNFTGNQLCIKRTVKNNPIHPLYQKPNSTLIPF